MIDMLKVRMKVCIMIMHFEMKLKEKVQKVFEEKYGISISNADLTKYYPRLKGHKHLGMGYNVDLLVLSIIVRCDLGTFYHEKKSPLINRYKKQDFTR